MFHSPGTPSFAASAPSAASAAAAAPARRPISKIRENVELAIGVLILTAFIRTFVFELYQIPTSSMTPTLLGTESPRVGFLDVDGDGVKDMILGSGSQSRLFDVYLRDGHRYQYAGVREPDESLRRRWLDSTGVYQDRIVVAKFLYWFSPPRRGDIIVFKVPPVIYERDKPTYIKRAAGLPGETLTFAPAPGVPGHQNTMGYLVANGQRVTSPAFFTKQLYECRNLLPPAGRLSRPGCIRYADHGLLADILEVNVPSDGVFAMGDNTVGSLDSRFWGAVPLDRLRGRAIFRCNPRYFPYIGEPGFLN